MPIFLKILFAVITLWCSVYTLSFAVFEIKNKRFLGGTLTVALVALQIAAYIKSIGF